MQRNILKAVVHGLKGCEKNETCPSFGEPLKLVTAKLAVYIAK